MDGKGKIIQISTTGVENSETTQCSFCTTVLCDDGKIRRQYGISASTPWIEITEYFYN